MYTPVIRHYTTYQVIIPINLHLFYITQSHQNTDVSHAALHIPMTIPQSFVILNTLISNPTPIWQPSGNIDESVIKMP